MGRGDGLQYPTQSHHHQPLELPQNSMSYQSMDIRSSIDIQAPYATDKLINYDIRPPSTGSQNPTQYQEVPKANCVDAVANVIIDMDTLNKDQSATFNAKDTAIEVHNLA